MKIYINGKQIDFQQPKQFSGGERHVQLPSGIEKHDIVEVMAQISDSNDMMDVLLTLDALSRMGSTDVSLLLPYFPYSRQDRVCADGQAYSLDLVVRMLTAAHANVKLLTFDMHSDVNDAVLSVPQSFALGAPSALADWLSDDANNVLLVCPDEGALPKCKNASTNSRMFKHGEMAIGGKVRDPKTGWISEYHLGGTEVDGRNCFIMDDICDGGMTFLLLAKELKARGAKQIVLFVTHGIFSKGTDELYKVCDQIWTTNTIDRDASNDTDSPDVIKVVV